MDKILHHPLYSLYHNSHSLGSFVSCRILSISRITTTLFQAIVFASGLRGRAEDVNFGLAVRSRCFDLPRASLAVFTSLRNSRQGRLKVSW